MKIKVYDKMNKCSMYWVDTVRDKNDTLLICVDKDGIIHQFLIGHPFIVIDNEYCDL